MKKLCSLLLILVVLSLNPSSIMAQSTGKSDSFQPYLSCQFEDGLEIVQRDRLPRNVEKFRMVETASGSKQVSRIDGYRVMFRYPKADYFFANVKVEQSDPQEYIKDKETVVEEIRHVAALDKAEVLTKTYNGFESYGVEDPIIDRGGTIAIQVLFSNEDKKIITIYFLNQGRKNRRFTTIEEFRTLKDNFLNRYTSCMVKR